MMQIGINVGLGRRIAQPKREADVIAHIEDWHLCLTTTCGSLTRRAFGVGRCAIACPIAVDSANGLLWYIVGDDPVVETSVPRSRTRIVQYSLMSDRLEYSDYFPEPFEATWFLHHVGRMELVALLTSYDRPNCWSSIDMKTGRLVLKSLPRWGHRILAVSPGHKCMVCTLNLGRLAIVTMGGEILRITDESDIEVIGACFSPDSKYVLMGGNPMRRWNLENGNVEELVLRGIHPLWMVDGSIWYHRDTATYCFYDEGARKEEVVVSLSGEYLPIPGFYYRSIATEDNSLIMVVLGGQLNENNQVSVGKQRSQAFATLVLERTTGEVWPVVYKPLKNACWYSGPLNDDFFPPLQ